MNASKENGPNPKASGSNQVHGVSDEEISRAVKTTDWDKMVELVLNGEGDRLMEQKSEDEEVQEFLDNIRAFQVSVQRPRSAETLIHYFLSQL